ncbi:MAG TPA: hypothetical protein VMA73_07835 [Streptosporangiaceae bacterium]|nr:hypothetical protein [Streptosporangiaceae bacterium]
MAAGAETGPNLAGRSSLGLDSGLAAHWQDLEAALSCDGPLERVTVNMISRAADALNLVVGLTGDTKTDAINRALQFYAYAELVVARGGAIYVQDSPRSEPQPLRFT